MLPFLQRSVKLCWLRRKWRHAKRCATFSGPHCTASPSHWAERGKASTSPHGPMSRTSDWPIGPKTTATVCWSRESPGNHCCKNTTRRREFESARKISPIYSLKLAVSFSFGAWRWKMFHVHRVNAQNTALVSSPQRDNPVVRCVRLWGKIRPWWRRCSPRPRASSRPSPGWFSTAGASWLPFLNAATRQKSPNPRCNGSCWLGGRFLRKWAR